MKTKILLYTSIFLLCLCYVNKGFAQEKYNCIEVWKNGVHRTFYEAGLDSITIAPPEQLPTGYDPYNGHECVDLGLPSGIKWATCNVGGDTSNDIGMYVSWADLEEKSYYDWDNTSYFDGYWNKQSKYCNNSSYGTVDDRTELDLEDDIAYQKWGENWRMPSQEDLQELIDYCSIKWDHDSQIFTITGLNENSIQFHLTGHKYRYMTEAIDPDDGEIAAVAMMWSRTLGGSSETACALSLSETGEYEAGYFEFDDFKRCYGCTVRPVSYFDESYYEKQSIAKLWHNGEYTQFAIEDADSIVFKVIDDNYKFLYNDHEYVDLGLKSGVMWATKNVGATSPVDNGYYLSWAETEEKSDYWWNTYTKYSNGKDALSGLEFTKYTWMEGNGPVDDNIELLPEDDAAHIHMGENWRTPSYYEFNELIRKCDRYNNSGVYNYPGGIGSVYVGSSGESIFLPAAGCKYEGRTAWLNDLCAYWMNHLWGSNVNAYALYDNVGSTLAFKAYPRYYGLPVRGIVKFMKMENLNTIKAYSSTNTIRISINEIDFNDYKYDASMKILFSGNCICCVSPHIEKKIDVDSKLRIDFVENCRFNIGDVVELIDNVKSSQCNQLFDLNSNGKNDVDDVDLMINEILSFSTEEANLPHFVDTKADKITTYSAELSSVIAANKISQIKECGFMVGTSSDSMSKHIVTNVNNEISLNLFNLDDDTYYYYVPYAATVNGVYYGNLSSFKTNKSLGLSTETLEVTDCSPNKATLNGILIDLGTLSITDYGFYYGTTDSPTTKISSSNITDSGEFSKSISSLSSNTTYYYKSFAKNSDGFVYGDIKSFKTPMIPAFENLYLKGSQPAEEHPRKDKWGLWLAIDATATLKDLGEYGIKETGFLVDYQTGNGMNYGSTYTSSLVTIKADLEGNSFSMSYNYYANTSSNSGAYVRPYVILENGSIIYMDRHYVYEGLESNYSK